ncbi:MAG: hypothetical protein ACREFC_01885, partial [Stellaceae bacterium]
VDRHKILGIKTIGIVSGAGSYFHFYGVSVVGSMISPLFAPLFDDKNQIDIRSWRLDDYIAEQAGNLLRGHYDIRPVTYDWKVFAEAWNDEQLSNLARKQFAGQNLDAYVVVAPVATALGLSTRTIGGFGLMENGNGLAGYEDQLYALYKITVVDGHSFAILGSYGATTGDDGIRVHGPNKYVDHQLYKDFTTGGFAAHRPEIDADLRSLISSSLPLTLKAVGLTD